MNIWTNGCYDVVHFGHMKLFEYAKSIGDKLFVGIDSDERIKKLKGTSRPINNQFMRMYFLEGIKYIDHVHIFNSSRELEKLVKYLRIDYIVVGAEYADKKVIGSDYADVIYFPTIKNISTSVIIDKIK